MLDWLDAGANAMHLDDLSVQPSQRHHLLVSKILDDIVRSEALLCVNPWESFDDKPPAYSVQFAIAHACDHLARAAAWKRACYYFTNIDVLFRVVDQARREGRYDRSLLIVSFCKALSREPRRNTLK
jgi:hypothetical protein